MPSCWVVMAELPEKLGRVCRLRKVESRKPRRDRETDDFLQSRDQVATTNHHLKATLL